MAPQVRVVLPCISHAGNGQGVFYMSDTAQRWYFRLERNRGIPTWPDFVDLVSCRFAPPLRSNPLGELAQLHRTGTVEDF